MKKNYYSETFIFLAMIYITAILVANVISFKVINIGFMCVTAGTLVFPITYILGDVFSEIYGFKKTKKIIMLGFICNVLMVILFELAIISPYPDYFLNQNEFSIVLSNTPRLLIASLVAYLVGTLTNSYVLNYIKAKSKIRFLWFRTISSTIIGEILDSILFLTIGFIGKIELRQLIIMIITESIIKILFEVVMTPVTYKVINKLKREEID